MWALIPSPRVLNPRIVLKRLRRRTIAVSGGGVAHKWSSPGTIVPLVVGFLALVAFFVAEFQYITNPTVPKQTVSNRTSLLAYIAVLLHGVIALAVIYVLPIYFQACLGSSPGGSGVNILPLVRRPLF